MIYSGLSFRPQIGLKLYDIFTLISISLTNEKDRKRSIYDNFEIYTKNLDEFLTVCMSLMIQGKPAEKIIFL